MFAFYRSILLAFSGMFVLAAGMTACEKGDDEKVLQLTISEQEHLLFMFEEEKLARDVYLYLLRKYDHMVFDHISGSEQAHMDAIAALLEQYAVENKPELAEGEFHDPALQELYDQLIDKGGQSLVEGLTVGAMIEDLDIRDLELAMAQFQNKDLLDTYERLACGSRNHIRAFTRNLDNLGETYQAQFITQERYDAIIDGVHESCGV